jgi:hypothetical protein
MDLRETLLLDLLQKYQHLKGNKWLNLSVGISLPVLMKKGTYMFGVL